MELKNQIINSSLNFFMRYGIKSVSMDDIAREVGISKKTLYQHISDKKELVSLSIKHHLKEDESYCVEVMHSTDNAIQQLLNLAQHIISAFQNLNPSTIFDIQKYYPKCWKLFTKHREEFILNQIKNNLSRGIESGLYRPELNADIVARLYISLVDASINPDVFKPNQFKQTAIFQQLFDYHLNAVMSEKGHEYFDQNKETLFTT